MNIKQTVLKAFTFDSTGPKGEIVPIIPGEYYRGRSFYQSKEFRANGVSHSDCLDVLFAKMKKYETQ